MKRTARRHSTHPKSVHPRPAAAHPYVSHTTRSRTILILIAILTIITIFLPKPRPTNISLSAHPPTIVRADHVYAHTTLETLTPAQQIGQLLFIGISGTGISRTTLTDTTSALMDTITPGGIILFSSNIQTSEQTTALTSALQTYATDHNLPPVFIAVDEEGGVVERISFDPVDYTQPQLGSVNSEETTRQTAQSTAQTLSQLGISVNFAPVADIAFSPDSIMATRSFGSTPQLVANHAVWMTDEFSKHGILATAKHFPGHGRTTTDSHTALPTVGITKEQWYESDAVPFQALIDHDIPFIMTGHILFPHVDSRPASLSPTWVQSILRREIGYDGIIVTDDIKMGALGTTPAQSALLALQAGNDMVIAVVDERTLLHITTELSAYYAHPDRQQELTDKLLRVLASKYRFLATKSDT